MKYERLKRFLITPEEVFTRGMSMCGVPYYEALDLSVVLCAFGEAKFDNRKYLVKTQDNSTEWRAKMDKITSEAEYDIIRIR